MPTNESPKRSGTIDPASKKLKPIWPEEKELEGSIGVSVSAATINDAGFTYRGASDLPPP